MWRRTSARASRSPLDRSRVGSIPSARSRSRTRSATADCGGDPVAVRETAAAGEDMGSILARSRAAHRSYPQRPWLSVRPRRSARSACRPAVPDPRVHNDGEQPRHPGPPHPGPAWRGRSPPLCTGPTRGQHPRRSAPGADAASRPRLPHARVCSPPGPDPRAHNDGEQARHPGRPHPRPAWRRPSPPLCTTGLAAGERPGRCAPARSMRHTRPGGTMHGRAARGPEPTGAQRRRTGPTPRLTASPTGVAPGISAVVHAPNAPPRPPAPHAAPAHTPQRQHPHPGDMQRRRGRAHRARPRRVVFAAHPAGAGVGNQAIRR